MQYWIMKSGLEIFDVARAYGLAALLSYADEAQSASPIVSDAGAVYCVDLPSGKPSASRLTGANNSGWLEAFAIGDFRDPLSPQWNSLFVSYTGANARLRSENREKTKNLLEQNLQQIIHEARNSGLPVRYGDGDTLPGALEPSAFKGLRGVTRGDYQEPEMKVDPHNWALGCLGGALSGRFLRQGNEYFVVYPLPERVEWSDFRQIRDATYHEKPNKGRRPYLSVQNAAAHYSVVLADHLRSRAASGIPSTSRYSNLLYFSLFQAAGGWKPGGAGRLNLQPLLDLALNRPHEAESVFKVWLYLFRRGSARGNEDLALAITDLVMHPTLDSYERHVRVFARYISPKKGEFQYNEQSLKEVTALVSS